MSCGVTKTLYGNEVAPAIMREYGSTGGCLCGLASKPKPKKMAGGGAGDGIGGTCSGGAPMLKALGIMQGGAKRTRTKRTRTKRTRTMTRRQSKQQRKQTQRGGTCGACRVFRGGANSRQCKPGSYKATAADKTRLARHLSGKSIGFTQRSSLKAKGLLRRANGTCKVSAKYQ
jgi:hypothetical protein